MSPTTVKKPPRYRRAVGADPDVRFEKGASRYSIGQTPLRPVRLGNLYLVDMGLEPGPWQL